MNNKLINLVKMLALSLALIGVAVLLDKRNDKREKASENVYDFAMGTSVQITLYGNSDKDKDYNAGDIVDEIKELDKSLISWREKESELYKLNNEYNAGEPYDISDELLQVLLPSLELSKASGGALDITIRPLAKLWNIEDATEDDFQVPTEDEIKDALSYVGYEAIDIYSDEMKDQGLVSDAVDNRAESSDWTEDQAISSDGANDKVVDSDKADDRVISPGEASNQVVLAKDGMILDLGATGKGYALDVAYRSLISHDVSGAMVAVGGSILIYGTKDARTKSDNVWRVGIRDPQGSQEDMIGYLEYACDKDMHRYISTSGDYEKYIEQDGIRYHHILDSGTGYPADSGLSGVTVVCDNGLISDGLSTACYVLGYEKSLALLDRYDAEAVFIDKDNNVIVTDGLKEVYHSN